MYSLCGAKIKKNDCKLQIIACYLGKFEPPLIGLSSIPKNLKYYVAYLFNEVFKNIFDIIKSTIL